MTIDQILIYVLAPIAGYLLGSIPFGLVIGKAHGVDIRTTGSKNIGATNLGRTLGKKYFWQAFFLDAAKGFLPVLIVSLLANRGYSVELGTDMKPYPFNPLGPQTLHGVFAIAHYPFPAWTPLLTAIACVLGHTFPIWLKFKGGKGVATSFGAVLGFWPLYTLAGLGGGLVFVVMLMIYRYISLASISAAIAFLLLVVALGRWDNHYLPTFMLWSHLFPLAGVAALFALLIIWRHRANIGRLMKGAEPKIGQRERDKANFK